MLQVCCRMVVWAIEKYEGLAKSEKEDAMVQREPHLQADIKLAVDTFMETEISVSKPVEEEQQVRLRCGHILSLKCLGTFFALDPGLALYAARHVVNHATHEITSDRTKSTTHDS